MTQEQQQCNNQQSEYVSIGQLVYLLSSTLSATEKDCSDKLFRNFFNQEPIDFLRTYFNLIGVLPLPDQKLIIRVKFRVALRLMLSEPVGQVVVNGDSLLSRFLNDDSDHDFCGDSTGGSAAVSTVDVIRSCIDSRLPCVVSSKPDETFPRPSVCEIIRLTDPTLLNDVVSSDGPIDVNRILRSSNVQHDNIKVSVTSYRCGGSDKCGKLIYGGDSDDTIRAKKTCLFRKFAISFGKICFLDTKLIANAVILPEQRPNQEDNDFSNKRRLKKPTANNPAYRC